MASVFVSRHPLSKKDRKKLLNRFSTVSKVLAETAKNASTIEIAKSKQGFELILADGKPIAVISGGSLLPTLNLALEKKGVLDIPQIVVDKGAVPHIINGADVMVPGIVRVKGDVELNSIVVIVDEDKCIPLAVGKALMSSGEIASSKKGRAIKNMHHYNDKIWLAVKTLLRR